MQYPYQLVTFLDKEPKPGEPIYGGANGWYPQIALKRRFGIQGITEEQLIQDIADYAAATKSFEAHILEVKRPERMPVEVIEVRPDQVLLMFHTGFIGAMGERIGSKYGDREGANYYPHVTLEYWKRRLFDPQPFVGTTKKISRIWLVKDMEGSEETVAYRSFDLT